MLETTPENRSRIKWKVPGILFGCFCLGLLILHLSRFFLRVPPVWPDESLFGAPAIDLVRRGKMGTQLLAEVLPGIGERTYWMPPVYFVALAGVFKIFGVSITVMRGFTLAASLAVIALTLLLAAELGAGLWGVVVSFSILALHELFESTLVVGRMESLVMLFLFGAAWLVARELNRSEQKPMRAWVFAGAGLLSGLAAMTHPFGIVGCAALAAIVLLHSPRSTSFVRRIQLLSFAALFAVLTVVPWGLYILQSPADFKAQFGSQMARKATAVAAAGFYDMLCFNLGHFSLKGWVLGALFIVISFAGYVLCGAKKRGAWAVFWFQALILAMLLTTREVWYPAYLVPLSAIGLGVMTNPSATRHLRRGLAVLLCLIAWGGTGYWLIRGALHRLHESVDMAETHVSPTAYLKWGEEISQVLPAGKRVLIASIPDPTFWLFSREDLTLRHFSPVAIGPKLYEQYVASADYIVVSDNPTDGIVGPYARSHGHLLKVVELPEDPLYKAYIYQMHP
jgi:4-amino-4-deoxy-L-arabinose transferase-like glycosyltransferase